MKKLLFILTCLLLTEGLRAQLPCAASFTSAAMPDRNNLLQVRLANTSPSPTAVQAASYLFSNASIGSYGGYSGGYTYITFPSPGTYPVNLTMTLRDSMTSTVICTSSITQNVTVSYPACGTTLNYTAGTPGSVNFTAATPAGTPGMIYNWSFGDGTTGTGASPVHTYTANGTYLVKVVATAPAPYNCTYTNTTTVDITDLPIGCSSNVAQFTSSISNNDVVFTNTSPASGTPGVNRRAMWWFGDGTSSYSINAAHTYSATGSYNVKMVSLWVDTFSAVRCTDTVIHTINITSYVPAAVTVNGRIICDSSYSGRTFKVWLITMDTATNLLAAIDSTLVGTGTVYGTSLTVPYSFTGQPSGDYRVKAAIQGGTAGVTGLVPTYADSSLYWGDAKVQVTSTGYIYNNFNIRMRTGITTSGPGFIAGNVSLGANKGTGGGASNMAIYLRNSSNNFVKMVYTDANGNYSFSNLPVGTYTVYPENMNYATTAATVSITPASPAVNAVHFRQDDARMSIKPGSPTSVPAVGMAVFNIYPNPANNKVAISCKNMTDVRVGVTITNITGQKMLTREISLITNMEPFVDVSTLPSGLYFMKLHSASGEFTQKLLIQH